MSYGRQDTYYRYRIQSSETIAKAVELIAESRLPGKCGVGDQCGWREEGRGEKGKRRRGEEGKRRRGEEGGGGVCVAVRREKTDLS